MLDHIFLSVSAIARSMNFYEAALVPLGITARLQYDPDYYAANVLDPDGNSLELVYKKGQHVQ